jgi:simple sugar transport system ATP-binding protein
MKVELQQIDKHFGSVHANDHITMTIPAGTIQGILGENGAGKSTLMKILSGFIQADSGVIKLDGKKVVIHTPDQAIHHGIGMLHQDPLDFPPMRVVDNLVVGSPGGLVPNKKEAIAALKKLQERFGFQIDPDAYVETLTVGERQQLEILRLLWLGARVLILDEPTTGISASQRLKLFDTLRKLAADGMTVIFVSHKLEEVEVLCHRIAVFQRGRMVGEAKPPYVTTKLVEMMFGKAITLDERAPCATCDPVLKVEHLEVEDTRLHICDINLEVCRGEVIGLAGMEGSGQRMFLRTLAGLTRPVGGKVIVHDKTLTGKTYASFRKAGVTYVPASRLEEGLISGLSLTEHFILAREQKGFIINRDAAVKETEENIDQFFIRGKPETHVEALSGGNQQRALLALQRQDVDVLLIEHPTRGLDIESSIWIWSKLKARCQLGATIVFISSDLEELLHYSDRILVFFGGKVSEPLDAGTTTVDQLGQLIGGLGMKS